MSGKTTNSDIVLSSENNNPSAGVSAMSAEEKSKYEINKMFDLAEKPVMEYMCYFLKKKPEELIEEYAKCELITDEIVLSPLEEYKSDAFLCFKLEVVDCDYKSNLPDELKNNAIIIDAIKFLEYAVKEVSSALTACNKKIAELMQAKSVYLELDWENFSFKPVYKYPPKHGIYLLNNFKKDLNEFYVSSRSNGGWEHLNEELKSDLLNKIQKTDELLQSIHYDEETAFDEEKKHNSNLTDYKRIGIIFTERLEVPRSNQTE